MLLFPIICLISFNSVVAEGEITQRYQETADAIKNYLVDGDGKGQTINKLNSLTSSFGPRLATSEAYQLAADYVSDQLKLAGADRVYMEEVSGIPLWSPGDPPGSAFLVKPRRKKIAMMALENSTATPPGGIQASAVVVTSFDELTALTDDQVRGRIVVYNQPWVSYSVSSDYRGYGAIRAAERGAVAALVRSVTPNSLYTVHTGMKAPPVDGVADIPVASITVEDAELLYRLQQTGHNLEVSLELYTTYEGTVSSKTIVAEITGSTMPEQLVVFGGHFDSVRVGLGSIDDGGGVAITWQSLVTLLQLGLKPKRTIRAVFWVAEEFGMLGGQAYFDRHREEASSMSIVMESDTGTSTPLGIHFTGNSEAQKIMQEVLDLLLPINANLLSVDTAIPGDVYQFVMMEDVPGAELFTNAGDKYFWYHHSHADAITAANASDLDLCSTAWATIAYVIADLDEMLPRSGDSSGTTVAPVVTTEDSSGTTVAPVVTTGDAPGIVVSMPLVVLLAQAIIAVFLLHLG